MDLKVWAHMGATADLNKGQLFLQPKIKMKKRSKWQLTPVALPGKSHGHRSLFGYSPWSPKESAMTEHAQGSAEKHSLGSATLGSQCKSLHSKGRTLLEWEKEARRARVSKEPMDFHWLSCTQRRLSPIL